MSHQYEVEIKSLLGTKENAEKFLETLNSSPYPLEKTGENSQLNHYFQWWNFEILLEKLQEKIPEDNLKSLENISSISGKHSVRTRFVDNNSILVVKLSVDDTTSSNGIQRMEWEYVFEWMQIDELDTLLLDSEFEYQAKWSRERVEYRYNDTNICLDKNAGYGYLVEFEKVISEAESVSDAEKSIREMMSALGVEELNQERLARMFDFYNQNWRNYYGTEKTFIIE